MASTTITLLSKLILKSSTSTSTTVTASVAAASAVSQRSSRLDTLIRRQSTSNSNSNSINIININMGITKEVIKEGNGQTPTKGQEVTVHCTGMGKNRDLSQKFWSTKDPGQDVFKFKVGLGQVIKGWDEGVMTMSKGETSKLTCTPDYAYGAGGFPAWGIQPNSTLLFEIELLDFK